MPEKRVLWFLAMDIHSRERRDSYIMEMAADGLSGCAPKSVVEMGAWLSTMPGLQPNGETVDGGNLAPLVLAMLAMLVGFAYLSTDEWGPALLAVAIASTPVAFVAMLVRTKKARRLVCGWGFLLAFGAIIGLT